MIAETVRFVAGPTLIFVLVVAVGLVIYERATKTGDEAKEKSAISKIRRCTGCQEIVAPSATTCRHCGQTLSSESA